MNFKDQVIAIVKKIPYGRVTTYGTVATLSNMPRGARLVGFILHNSAERDGLPWQRIINREGYISIKSLEYSKELQREFLLQEGVEVSGDFMVDLDKYGWWG